MRYRMSSALAFGLVLSLLAACGGGGGGGSVNPTIPGGGNGGNPSPSASANPTSTPSGGPSGTPGITPTPVTTQTPGATPTPVVTSTPPSTPVPTPTPNPNATPTPNRTQTVSTGYGEVNGTDDVFVSNVTNTHNAQGEGDMAGSEPGSIAGGGGQGSAVDGISCATSMSNDFHVHAFVGIINNGNGAFSNGNEVALPDGIGMVQPRPDAPYTYPNTNPPQTVPNQTQYADCFYFIHTHDASGLVHMEAPSSYSGIPPCGAQATPPYSSLCNESVFTLGNILDIWGVSLTPANFGPLNGTVGLYGTSGYQACPSTGGACYTGSNQYAAIPQGQWQSWPMYHMSVIWIVVGTQPTLPSDLPNIEWVAGGGR